MGYQTYAEYRESIDRDKWRVSIPWVLTRSLHLSDRTAHQYWHGLVENQVYDNAGKRRDGGREQRVHKKCIRTHADDFYHDEDHHSFDGLMHAHDCKRYSPKESQSPAVDGNAQHER